MWTKGEGGSGGATDGATEGTTNGFRGKLDGSTGVFKEDRVTTCDEA